MKVLQALKNWSKPVATTVGLGTIGTAGVLYVQNVDERFQTQAQERTALVKTIEDDRGSIGVYKKQSAKDLADERAARIAAEKAFKNYRDNATTGALKLTGDLGALRVDQETSRKALREYAKSLGLTIDDVKGLKSSIGTVASDVNDLTRTVDDVSGRVDDVSGRVTVVETGLEGVKGKVVTLEGSHSKLVSRVNNFKTDNEKLREVYNTYLPSAAFITFETPEGKKGSLMGAFRKNKDGEYALFTAGHGQLTREQFMGSKFNIDTKLGFEIEGLEPSKMPNGEEPWYGVNKWDYAALRLPKEAQKILKKAEADSELKIPPLLTPEIEPELLDRLVVIGRHWRPVEGSYRGPHQYPWQGLTQRDLEFSGDIEKGDSGGVVLDSRGRQIGVVSWGDAVVVVLRDEKGKQIKGTKAEIVNANSRKHYPKGYVDIHRAMQNWDWKDASVSSQSTVRNKLLETDLLEDRPHLLAPPVIAHGFGDLFSHLAQLAGVDRYAFEPKKK